MKGSEETTQDCFSNQEANCETLNQYIITSTFQIENVNWLNLFKSHITFLKCRKTDYVLLCMLP